MTILWTSIFKTTQKLLAKAGLSGDPVATPYTCLQYVMLKMIFWWLC